MVYTEEKAKGKMCCMLTRPCLGNDCMAWTWIESALKKGVSIDNAGNEHVVSIPRTSRLGKCGLVHIENENYLT